MRKGPVVIQPGDKESGLPNVSTPRSDETGHGLPRSPTAAAFVHPDDGPATAPNSPAGSPVPQRGNLPTTGETTQEYKEGLFGEVNALKQETNTPSCTMPNWARYFLRSIPAGIPSALFGALALDNANGEVLGFDLGKTGRDVQYVLYPTLSFLVNFATAWESQAEFVEMLVKQFRSETTVKERLGFVGSIVLSAVAAVSTVQMAQDGAEKMGVASKNPHMNTFLNCLAIFGLSGLYSVTTRITAIFGLASKELPQFLNWIVRKYHLLTKNDPQSKFFEADVSRFIETEIKSERQLRELYSAFLNAEQNTQQKAGIIAAYLENAGYHQFPSVMKMLSTTALVAGCPLLWFLVYKLSREGDDTVGVHETYAKAALAGIATVMTAIFYARASIKFYDRTIGSYNALQELSIDQVNFGKKLAFFAAYALLSSITSIATSAGFVFESKKLPLSDTLKLCYQFFWIVYSGWVANVGYTYLKVWDVVRRCLDQREIEKPFELPQVPVSATQPSAAPASRRPSNPFVQDQAPVVVTDGADETRLVQYLSGQSVTAIKPANEIKKSFTGIFSGVVSSCYARLFSRASTVGADPLVQPLRNEEEGYGTRRVSAAVLQ